MTMKATEKNRPSRRRFRQHQPWAAPGDDDAVALNIRWKPWHQFLLQLRLRPLPPLRAPPSIRRAYVRCPTNGHHRSHCEQKRKKRKERRMLICRSKLSPHSTSNHSFHPPQSAKNWTLLRQCQEFGSLLNDGWMTRGIKGEGAYLRVAPTSVAIESYRSQISRVSLSLSLALLTLTWASVRFRLKLQRARDSVHRNCFSIFPRSCLFQGNDNGSFASAR